MHKAFRFAALGVVALAMSVMLAACGPVPHNVALAGSDTTVGVMGALSNLYNGNSSNNPNGDHIYNVPPVLPSGQSFTVPADSPCPGVTYNNPSNLPPNGSSAGINALLADSNGCLDVARASRGRSASDPSTIDFYAYAIDGVSWANYGGNSPQNLTQAQLQGIYLCTNAGNPTITNWNQVGGNNAAIIRYLPQTGSGTLSFFETRILGLSSAQQGVLDDSSCNTHPIRIEENSGNQVATGNKPNAIEPYSFANWTAQKNGVTTDIRGGAVLGQVNGVAPSTTSEGLSCGSSCFLGRRYVYNVLKQNSPNFNQARDFVGVTDASHIGFVCKGSNSVIFTELAWGFVPLANGSTGPGLPNSFCRKNPTPL